MEIDRWLASNEALGVALVVSLVTFGWFNRSFLRVVADDGDAPWRVLARLALSLSALFAVWTSLFDNWRQLVGLPYRAMQQFPSERAQINPPSATVRDVTFLLLGLSLVPMACLFARHVGGYATAILLLIATVVFWAPLFIVRQRFDLDLALGFGGDIHSVTDVAGYAVYLLAAWSLNIALIALMYLGLLAVVALPVTLFLDLTHLRQPRTTAEAVDFFTSLGNRAAGAAASRDPHPGAGTPR